MKLYKNDPEFYKRVFKLALPIAFQSLITTGVNMLDNIMVGQLQDEKITAVAQANVFIGIYHILCMGLGMGASVLVSRYWGMKNSSSEHKEEAGIALKQTVTLMLRLAMGLAAIFAIVTAVAPKTVMSIYTKDPLVMEFGANYFKYSIATYFFTGASLVTTLVLRSVGQVKLPMFVSIGAFFVNMGANYAFIFGHFGAPRMEESGAALGTLIARIFEATCIMGYFLIVDKKIGYKIKDIFLKTRNLIGEYFRICIPVLISDGILAIGNSTVASVIGKLSNQFAAANSITATTQQLSTVTIQGVCQAGAIVTGQTLGSGGKEKTQEQGWLFLGLGFALGAVSAGILMIICNPIINSYNGAGEEVKEIARDLMKAISLIIIFQATNSIMTKGVLRGGGDTKMLMVADNIFLWALSIPLGYLAGYVFKLDVFWVYFFLKIDQITKTIWCVIRLRSGKWIKKITTGKNAKMIAVDNRDGEQKLLEAK
ncbi:MAG: MATE family efflux transporter [Lachnospiraceae bacterium]|nr:MATE family efflux transporter [Lachnospiraceae bacterium]